MSTGFRWLITAWLVIANSASAEPADIRYSPVPANPSYADVTSLPFRSHDLKHAYGDHPDQYGLLWLPTREQEVVRPAVVLVHGGCWLNAYDINHTRPLATALAAAGYRVWNLEYRRAEASTPAWPASLEDLQRGVRALHELADQTTEGEKLILLGHSAGGHLALLLAASLGQHFPDDAPVAAAVGMAAITDIERYAQGENSCQQAAATFIGGTPETHGEAFSAANPVRLELDVPITLMHGDDDLIVPRAQFDALAAPSVTRELVPAAGHFDWVHPGTPAFQRLLLVLDRFHSDEGSAPP